MQNTSTKSVRRRWYATAFLLLLVPVGELSYLSVHHGGLSHRVVIIIWAASAFGGITCALGGSGGLNKNTTDLLGSLALVLHIASLAVLMVLEALAASGTT